MKIFCISDLHLSFSVPNKSMDIFGTNWKEHYKKIEVNWRKNILKDDIVCLAGDISWASTLDEVKKDLEWIHSLPGIKCLIKGNHDHWFSSKSKMQAYIPPSINIIYNDAFHYKGVGIGGSRLWDSPRFNFNALFLSEYKEKTVDIKIFKRELQRLELSLSQIDQTSQYKIALTHYPPISLDLQENEVTKLLKKYQINTCLFGHLHGLNPNQKLFGRLCGIDYKLTTCDYLDFNPLFITSL